ncbi:MAG: hypothetical protein Q4A46_00005, partial [Clostridia bacterium]|nr:hypothetical protein [Clostridia bacterium]
AILGQNNKCFIPQKNILSEIGYKRLQFSVKFYSRQQSGGRFLRKFPYHIMEKLISFVVNGQNVLLSSCDYL